MAGYIIKVTMENTHPPVWRRLVIPDKILFSDLHQILQDAFGWTDTHLHDFSFPGTDFRVVQSEEDFDFASDAELESTVLLDDFLKDYSWIRYTYDFGDDWTHKIVFEKADPDYKNRYAQVIKYKGDNFAEDSGGIYGEYWAQEEDEEYDPEDYRRGFDLEFTNEILQAKTFPARRRKKKTASPEYTGFGEKEMQMLTKQFQKLLKESALSEWQKPAEPLPGQSAIEKEEEAWDVFWTAKEAYEKKDQGNGTVKKKAPEYEQLTLPFIEKEKVLEADYGVFLSSPVLSMSAHLTKYSATHLEDYCRYLQDKVDPKSKKKNAETYIRILKEHPEYLFMIFTQDELETLWKLQTMPLGLIDPEPEELQETVLKALHAGIMTCKIRKKNKKQAADVSFTLEGNEIVTAMRNLPYKKQYREIVRLEEELRKNLIFYGLIEMDEWYRITRKQSIHRLSPEEFRRYVYWHLTQLHLIKTGTDINTGATYAFLPELEPDRIITMLHEHAENLPWKELSRIEQQRWDQGFGAFYQSWGELGDYIISNSFDEESGEDLISGFFLDVLHGSTVDEIFEQIKDIFPIDTVTENVILWKSVYDAVFETGLPGLKGHSREEYRKLTGKEGPAAFGEHLVKKRNIRQTTHIYKMEPAVQKKIVSHIETGTEQSAAEFEKFIDECGGNNEEMLYFLGAMYAGIDQFEDALRIYEKLKKLHKGNKEDILESIRYIGELKAKKAAEKRTKSVQRSYTPREEEEEKIVPFRRETKKILPNDPCPCGSGKKYKHCCGRNK